MSEFKRWFFCLSYVKLASSSTFSLENKQDRSYLSLFLPRTGTGDGLGVCDVTMSHPCAFGPHVTHDILCRRWEASTVQWVSDLQVKVKSSEVYRNKHEGGFCLSENEDGNCRAGVVLHNDMLCLGKVALRLGIFSQSGRWVAVSKGVSVNGSIRVNIELTSLLLPVRLCCLRKVHLVALTFQLPS